MTRTRCPWGASPPVYVLYHDTEWGVPLRQDQKLFEMLILESAQAGLSWLTVLSKRDAYREAFSGFNPRRIAKYDNTQLTSLLANDRIIRNRRKIESAINNARRYLEVQNEFGSFHGYIWGFVDGHPIQNSWRTLKEIPSSTLESKAMSKDLKARGFTFIGPTICYAYMQATGMVNDHLVECFRHHAVQNY